jgi:hypothetical protein
VAQPAQDTWQSDRGRSGKIGECSSSKTTARQLLTLLIVKHEVEGVDEPAAQELRRRIKLSVTIT